MEAVLRVGVPGRCHIYLEVLASMWTSLLSLGTIFIITRYLWSGLCYNFLNYVSPWDVPWRLQSASMLLVPVMENTVYSFMQTFQPWIWSTDISTSLSLASPFLSLASGMPSLTFRTSSAWTFSHCLALKPNSIFHKACTDHGKTMGICSTAKLPAWKFPGGTSRPVPVRDMANTFLY